VTALRGETPSTALLRRLAPVLGFHAADLFVMAGRTVPKDLAPVDPAAGGLVGDLLGSARDLTPQQRDMMRAAVDAMPQWPQLAADRDAAMHERHTAGPGGLLMRMARNRNLSWTGTAQVFQLMTGRYWSAATYGSIAYGRAALTPDLLLDFATVLGVRVDDLAALTGVTLTGTSPDPEPKMVELAELLWEARRLTAAQLRRVVNKFRYIDAYAPKRGNRFTRWLPGLPR
jgi:hypothetical protein